MQVILDGIPFQQRQLSKNESDGQAHKAKHLKVNPYLSALCSPDNLV